MMIRASKLIMNVQEKREKHKNEIIRYYDDDKSNGHKTGNCLLKNCKNEFIFISFSF